MTAHEPGGRLSPTQQGIWLDERRAPQGSAYSLPFLLTLDGQPDAAVLAQACGRVLARHPVLSCAVREDTGGIPALVPAPLAPRVVTTRLGGTGGAPADDLDALLGAAVAAEIGQPFDLVTGPLIRLTLILPGPRPPVLLVVAHHLVFDRPSMDIFARDLATCYASAARGQGSEHPAVMPAARAHWAGDDDWVAAMTPRARAYWSARWREPAALWLPHAARAAAGMTEGSHATESTEFRLGPRQRARLRAAAGCVGVTPFEYLLATLVALLYRYGNRSPSVSIALGQRTSASAGMIGPFVQEVPFAVPLAGDMSFGGFVRGLRGSLRELYEFRRFPLGLALPGASPAAVQAPVSMSYARHNTTVTVAGQRITWRFLFNFHSRSPLSVSVLDEGDTVRVMLRHAPDFIDAVGVASFARHWRRLSYAGAACPTRPVAGLPLLSRGERTQITTRFNATGVSYPPGTFLRLFSAQAARTPGRTAVACGATSMTYAELDAASSRLANVLPCAGVRADRVAAILMRPSARRLLTVLAVLKAGAAYLPLEVGTPPARLGAIVGDASVTAVLTDGPGDAAPFGPEVRVLCADDLGAGATISGTGGAPRPRHERDLAYVIYTSGSTGCPKGVAVDHGALANLLHAFGEITRTGTDATWLAHTSLAFDMAVLELYLPLVTGGTVVIARDHEAKQGGELLRLVRERSVTHLQATPSGWELLLAAGFDEPGATAIVGGEALSLPLSRRLRPRTGRLLNAYGPTEATVWASYAEVPRDAEDITIGRPIANTRAYVLGNRGEVMPAGCAGELFIAGRGLARGYFRRPAQTAERFVADAFGPAAGRMYRTGDRARYRADGNIEFLGRLDDQVKVRGHRIELGEVEARLAAHPGVGRCAVAARGEEGLGRRLVAFISPANGQPPPSGELGMWMAEVLPGYMLPATYVVLDQFPLTATGKLDRASLPDPPAAGVDGSAPAAAGDPLEQRIRQVCREVLRVRDVDVTANLFDLGANSLTIMQISRCISVRMGVALPLELLFEAPTVAGIAGLALEAGHRPTAVSAGP